MKNILVFIELPSALEMYFVVFITFPEALSKSIVILPLVMGIYFVVGKPSLTSLNNNYF